MPKKKKAGIRGSSPEKTVQGGVTNDRQYGSQTSSWIEVSDIAGTWDISKDSTFNQLQDMFKGSVDGEVVYMVLTECNWKVEEATDKLLSMVPEGNTDSRISLKNVAQTLHSGGTMNHNIGMRHQIALQQPVSANIPIPGQGQQPQKLRSRLPSVPGKDGSPGQPIELETLSPRTPQASLDFVPFHGENMPDNTSVQSGMQALDSYASGLQYVSQYELLSNVGPNNMYMAPNDRNHNQVNAANTAQMTNFVPPNFLPDTSQPPPGKGMAYSQMGGLGSIDMIIPEDPYYLGNLETVGPQTSPGMLVSSSGYVNRTTTPAGNVLAGYAHTPGTMYLPTALPPTSIYLATTATVSKTSPVSSTQANYTVPSTGQSAYNNSTFTNTAPNPFAASSMPAFNQPPPPLPQRPQVSPNALRPPGQNKNTVPTSPSFRAQRSREKDDKQPPKKGRRHGRKPAISLDPAERESLEQLIEEVIIGGVGEDIMGDDSSASSDEETDKSTKKEKKDGKQHPSHLKVAAKHMKNLPPRFLRRLQVAQKQGEIRLDTQPEGMQQLNLEPEEEEEEEEKETQLEKDQKKFDAKKPKKKGNLLESLDSYFDDFVSEEKQNGKARSQEMGGVDPAYTTMGSQHLPEPAVTNTGWSDGNVMSSASVLPSAMTCEDLERELVGPNGQPMMPHTQSLMMAGQPTIIDKKIQFSVNAPEFVPRTFAPITTVMSTLTNESPNRIGSPAFMKPTSPFHVPMGRMSPQMPLQGQVVQLNSQGGPSPSASPGPPTFLIPKVQPPAQGSIQPVPFYPPAGFPFRPNYPPPGPQGQYPPPRPFLPPGASPPWAGDKGQRHHKYHGKERWPGQQLSPGSRHPELPDHYPKNIPNAQRLKSDLNGAPSPPMKLQSIDLADKILDSSNNLAYQDPAIIETKLQPKEMLKRYLEDGKKVMVLLRGCPGSGKSTLARELEFDGVTLTTDDFFYSGPSYDYDPSKLSDAHEWNQQRAKEAVESGKNPVIIDNTNIQAWEMKYYVTLAASHNYVVEILEPETPWKYKAKELVKRNKHGVPLDTIQRMLERFEHNVSVASILASSNRVKLEAEQRQIIQLQAMQDSTVPGSDPDLQKKSHRKKKRKRRRGRKSPGTEGDKQEEDSEEEEGTPEKEGEIQEAKQTPEKEDNLKGIPEDDETSDKTSVKETLSDCAHSNASDGHKSVLEPVPEILHEAVSDENIVILGSVSTDKVGNNDCDARTAENIDTTETDSASAGEHKDSVICEKADDKNVQSKESVSDVRKSVRRSSVRKYSCEIKSVEPELLVDALENVMKVLTDKAHIDNDVIEETIREHMRHLDAPDSIKEEIEIIIMVKMLEMSQANEEAHKEAMSLAREQVAELTKAHAKSQDLRSPTKENVNQAHNEASATDSLVEEDFDLEEAYQEYLKTLPDKLGVEQAYWTNRPHDAYALNLQASASSSSLSQGDSELSWVESGYKQPGKLPGATASSKPRRVQKRGQKSKMEEMGVLEMGVLEMGGDWQLPQFTSSYVLPPQPNCDVTVTRNATTYTLPKDFSAVTRVTEGLRLTVEDNMQGVLACRPRDILAGLQLPYVTPVASKKLLLDKSCSTDDLQLTPNLDKLETLRSMFPAVTVEDLGHILSQCAGDVEWAVNILLDSGLEYNVPQARGGSTPGRHPRESVTGTPKGGSEPRSSPGQVSPLAVLCQEKLDPTSLLAKDQVQENLVRGSVRRLQSIEEYTRKSICEDSPPEKVGRERVASLSLPADYSAAAADKSMSEMDDMYEDTLTDASQMNLTLSPALAKQLIAMFGPVGFHISPDSLYGDDLAVTLNRKTARQIHRRWALTLKEKFQFEEDAIRTMIQEDEALARKLQEEEDAEMAKYQHLVESQPTPVMPAINDVRFSPPPSSLREIMDEEAALEASRREFMAQVNSRSREATLATKMKRMKLIEMFPKVDAQVLEEIFSANHFSLGATVAAIQGSDLQSEAQTIMSAEALAAYEQQLLDEATRESLNQWPGTEEDDDMSFQTLDDPTYQDLRAEASLHYKLRHECFQKAQHAYKSNKKTVASFYSQQGHLHTLKLKAANRRAAEKMLELRHGSLQQTNTLDLHGLHVDEALDILESVLDYKEAEPLERRRCQHLTIVTGRGSHSRGGVAKIKPAVVTFLHKNNYNFTEPNPGLLKVLLYLKPAKAHVL